MLRHRLPVSVVLILSFVGLLIVDGLTKPYHAIWMSLAVVAGILASIEISPLLTATIGKPFQPLLLTGVIICLASNIGASILGLQGISALGPLACAFVLALCLVLVESVRRFDDISPVVVSTAATVLGIAYIGILGSFLILLRFSGGADAGLFRLIFVVGATKGTDIGAYTCGRLFGRHLMTPRLSPKKTWEGALGGVLFSVLIVSLISMIENSTIGVSTFGTWPSLLVFALCVSVAGQLGDLVESMLKREAHVKDASSTIPGFGGVLDLLDSLFLAAPSGWLILTILR